MIIRLDQDTPKLGLRIVQPGCTGKQLMDTGVELLFHRPTCYSHAYPVHYWEDCKLNWRWRHIPQVPTLTYPAFEIDDDGLVVFYFDDKLWNLPRGRYIAQVVIGKRELGPRFDVDLQNRPVTIDFAVVVPETQGNDAC